MKDGLKDKIKQYSKKHFVNRETAAEIATSPEELPPLRSGYARLIHQTGMDSANSFLENGLVYNREYANKQGFSRYLDVSYMAVAYTDENRFWERLTHEEIRHRGADAIAIFDVPEEELGAHQKDFLAQYLNGTISRGYLVGVIPNYGTQGFKKLSVSEMEKIKKISQSNPLPPFYETPNWRESVKNAWAAFQKQQEKTGDNLWGGIQKTTQPDTLPVAQDSTNGADAWADWIDTYKKSR